MRPARLFSSCASSIFFIQCVYFIQVTAGLSSHTSRPDHNSVRYNKVAPITPEEHLSHTRHYNDFDALETAIPPNSATYYFDQLIDHSNPNAGTFKQRYWQNWEFYQQGGPIFLTTPGEHDASSSLGNLNNSSMQGTLAQYNDGTAVVLEHRFFGASVPFQHVASEELKFLTISQSIQDLVYFAQNVNLSVPGGDVNSVRPHKAPWVLSGGSYAGALTAWTMNKEPGVFWAGYSSSGVVQPIADFWEYWEPVRQNMPQNCSADVQLVVDYMDTVVSSGNSTLIKQITTDFGLNGTQTVGEFLLFMQIPMGEWQLLTPSSTKYSIFYEFCDALEIRADGQVATEAGWGLENALAAWAKFYNDSQIYNEYSSAYASATTLDPSALIDQISWQWMVCNEVGWIQRGPPEGQPAIAFRQFSLADQDNLCHTTFRDAFTSTTLESRVQATNITYKGWSMPASDRLFVVNGKRDPWLGATLSAPSQNIPSTDLRPIMLSDGFHCSDLLMDNALMDPSIANIQSEVIKTMKVWLASFTPSATPVATTYIVTATPVPNGARRLGLDSWKMFMMILPVLGAVLTL